MSKNYFYTLILVFFTVLNSIAQEKFTLSGTISDKNTNETLIGVSINIPKAKKQINTNEYGYYAITLPKGEYDIKISYLGYEPLTVSVSLNKNIQKDLKLTSKDTSLDEIVITGIENKTDIRKPEMSVNKMSAAAIKKIPAVLGEADVIKSLLTLPGVTNAGEGASGFNVRGGAADQNLILLDEATVFNSSHLFGFFSVFNPDAVKDLKLYKGGIPARYGGRASSVLDIYQKEGSSKNFHVNGGIGLLTSKLLVEGPIVKDRGSFLIGGRATYAHLFMNLSPDFAGNSAYFYDLNTKLNYKLDAKNNLFLSGYFGRDIFAFGDSFTNEYGNSTLNTRWNHLFSDKIFSNLSMIYSDYFYGLKLDFVGFKWTSGIKNYNIKYDFKHYLNDNIKLNYGANAIYYDFNPGLIEPSNPASGITASQFDKKYAFEPALYLSAEQEIGKNLSVSYGLRYSMFYRLGESNVNIYENNSPVVYNPLIKIYESATPVTTKRYDKNEVIQSFDNFEPRASVSYQFNESNSVKVNYNRMAQYLQLVSNTNSPTPLDIWTPSDNYIKPQIADQVAFGYFRNFKDGDYSLETETFYKEIQNRLDYIDGANLIGNEKIETAVLNGQMRSYGLEVMLKKNSGRLNGWVSYTLSKSEQKTPGRTPEEIGINNGEWYTSAYDKRHNLAVTGSYTLNKKWSFGTNFVLQSGQPVTYPNGQYQYLGLTIPSYGLRNENRLPAYHHLDLSVTLTPKKNNNRKWKGEWVFSIYNIYNRKNAASISFRENQDTGLNEAVKLSIFGAIPAVIYNFKF
ncbi:MAG: carboxypeptidase-like regulatory domain-containing protein [Flavobacterium sp.]